MLKFRDLISSFVAMVYAKLPVQLGFINVYNQSLSDVLGVRMSATLKRLRINYGQKVDIKQFFNRLLTPSLSADINKVNNVRNN